MFWVMHKELFTQFTDGSINRCFIGSNFYSFPFMLKKIALDFSLSSILTFRIADASLCWWSLRWSLVFMLFSFCRNGKADSWLVRMFESLRVDRFAIALVAHQISFYTTNRKWWINCRILSGGNLGKSIHWRKVESVENSWIRSEGWIIHLWSNWLARVWKKSKSKEEINRKAIAARKKNSLMDRCAKLWNIGWKIKFRGKEVKKIVKYRKKKWKQVEKEKSPTMALYRLLVLHWSIFTLSTQLILCASIYSSKWIDFPSIWFTLKFKGRRLASTFMGKFSIVAFRSETRDLRCTDIENDIKQSYKKTKPTGIVIVIMSEFNCLKFSCFHFYFDAARIEVVN